VLTAILGPGLRVLFVGINPSLRSAEVGHHFAGPSNRFWPTLHAAGFTPRRLRPDDDAELPSYGVGVTNIASRATRAAAELSRAELRAGAVELERTVREHQPELVAVVGLGAYRTAFARPAATTGLQAEDIGGRPVWVLPNPSGLNAHYKPADFARLYAEARAYADELAGSAVRLVPWGDGDLPLLAQLVGDPTMMEHLGGPESPEQIAERQARYALPGSGMFKVVDEATGDGVGSVGYWARAWRGEEVLETGWSVIPAFQGRGVAARATAQAIAMARSERSHRFVHAFPSADNPASNAICRKLGFALLGETRFEYPPGSFMRCNAWRLELAGAAGA
jgi:TDG/mug DNA glycosylase family protein